MYRLIILLAFIAAGCEKKDPSPEKAPQLKVIAKRIAPPDCDKLCLAKYVVLNSIVGNLKTNDTVTVGYYSYQEYKDAPETAILTLEEYAGKSKIKNYFIFPDYDARKGLEPINIGVLKAGKTEYDTIYSSDLVHVIGNPLIKSNDILHTSLKFVSYIDFDDYPVAVDNTIKAKLDLSSHQYGRMYRTNLREAYKESEANFAGHYTLATWGCGSPCQQSLLIDRHTGKIYDAPTSSLSVNCKANSRMLLVNPPDDSGFYDDCLYCIPEIYIFNERDKKFYRKKGMYDAIKSE